jgi:2-oxoglutarate dehydrogenase E2 component (dihydrolipoamide succinyltransferase)
VNAEKAGILKTMANESDTIFIGAVLAQIDDTAEKPAGTPAPSVKETPVPEKTSADTAATPAQSPVTAVPNNIKATPVASAIIADKNINPAQITPSGFGGKIVKHDVLDALANPGKKAFSGAALFSRNVRKEKMSNLRKTISKRLVEAKNTTAMLTTFNEVDMTRILDIRKIHKDKFKEAHDVNLGFMSFFAKASVIALSEWPAVNAFNDGDELVYHDYAEISIAVSTPRGLTVPVIRNVESLSMADIE